MEDMKIEVTLSEMRIILTCLQESITLGAFLECDDEYRILKNKLHLRVFETRNETFKK